MASAVQKEIGGRKWSFGTMPATKAVRVEVAIASVIGEALFKISVDIDAASGQPDAEKERKQVEALSAAIGLLTAKMDPDKLLETMNTVFEYCSCDGQRVDIDSTFTGRNKDLWVVFMEALKVNFSDFFAGGLSDSLAAMIRK